MPEFPSAMVTSLILKIGVSTVMLVQTCSLSTSAQADPLLFEVDVKIVCASPAANGLLAVERLPLVLVKAASGSGNEVTPVGIALAESCVMSAVTVEVPFGLIGFGAALTFSWMRGSKSAPVPFTPPHPVLFGPALQPHQLSLRLGVALFGLSIAVVGEMMRLTWAVAVPPLRNCKLVRLL